MRARLLTSTAAILLAMVVSPCLAWGAAPVAVGEMEVQLWPEASPGQAIAIIAVTLDPDTQLPATVRIPVPDGLTIDWAGEIAGEDPAGDILREYTLKDGEGGKYAEFEVSTSRDAQVEASGIALAAAGGKTTASLDFVLSVPASATTMSVRLPAGLEIVKVSPDVVGEPAANSTGEKLYTLEAMELGTGDSTEIEVSYRTAAEDAAATTDWLLIALGAATAFAVAVLAGVVARNRRRSIRTVEE